MDEQDDPQTLEVYRLVKEGWTDESGFGGVHSSRRVVGLPPGPGEGGVSLGLRSQSLGRATRPGGAGLWRAGRLLGGKQRLPRLDRQRRDPHGIDTGRPDLASSAPGKPQKRNIQFCPPSDTFRGQLGYGLPHLAEGGLARGGGPVGAHFCPPVPVESSPVGSCLRVSDFRLYCYFLKKKNPF